MNALIVLGVFVLALLLQVPVAFSLGVASVVYLYFFSSVPMTLVIQSLFTSCDSFPMLCVPFFVMAGEVMMAGHLSQKLVDFFKYLMGNVKGKLGIICVVTSAFFAAISGSGAATVACIGGILVPSMVNEHYDKSYSTSLACCAGALGPVIPPSVPAIVYAVTAGVSISTMFLSGFGPGLLLMILLALYNRVMAQKYKFGAEFHEEAAEETQLKKSFGAVFKDSIWAVLVPFIILGGIYGGIFSPTEAAVVATTYALIVSFFVYRSIKLKDMPTILSKTVMTTGTIMILMGCASAFGRVLTMEQIPTTIAKFILSLTDSKILILLFINIFLLVVGMLMETSAAIVILVPIFLPIVTSLGVDPIHFGAIVVFNLAIGLCTPPVGLNLFVGTRLANTSIDKMMKWLSPMIGIMILVLLIMTYCEPLALLLPRLLGGYGG